MPREAPQDLSTAGRGAAHFDLGAAKAEALRRRAIALDGAGKTCAAGEAPETI